METFLGAVELEVIQGPSPQLIEQSPALDLDEAMHSGTVTSAYLYHARIIRGISAFRTNCNKESFASSVNI
jgi:hypothetical protein